MARFCPLASGSKGNCIYLKTGETELLIDAGIGIRALKRKLEGLGTSLDKIHAILITHEHGDHVGGLETILKEHQPVLLANRDTAGAIRAEIKSIGPFHLFSTGEPFTFRDLKITPFSISHDTLDPVAFVIEAEGKKIGVCADLGFVSSLVVNYLKGVNVLYIEANHEPSMVHACSRPMRYKQRVLGRQGHLSNQECASLIEKIMHNELEHIYLAHLSSECNSPKKALDVISQVMTSHKATLSLALQDETSHLLEWG